jgi:hypothetical protein
MTDGSKPGRLPRSGAVQNGVSVKEEPAMWRPEQATSPEERVPLAAHANSSAPVDLFRNRSLVLSVCWLPEALFVKRLNFRRVDTLRRIKTARWCRGTLGL